MLAIQAQKRLNLAIRNPKIIFFCFIFQKDSQGGLQNLAWVNQHPHWYHGKNPFFINFNVASNHNKSSP